MWVTHVYKWFSQCLSQWSKLVNYWGERFVVNLNSVQWIIQLLCDSSRDQKENLIQWIIDDYNSLSVFLIFWVLPTIVFHRKVFNYSEKFERYIWGHWVTKKIIMDMHQQVEKTEAIYSYKINCSFLEKSTKWLCEDHSF